MDSIQTWAILLGLVTPFVVSFVAQPRWSATQKRVFSVVIAAVIGVGNLIVQGLLANFDWSFNGIVSSIVLVLGASQAAYSLLWKPTGVADAVEEATSPKSVE